MLEKVLQLLNVSCRHKNISRPVAAAAARTAPSDDWEPVTQGSGHYVVCLDCGKKFQYDWAAMRIIR
jgi:hypothetical protein